MSKSSETTSPATKEQPKTIRGQLWQKTKNNKFAVLMLGIVSALTIVVFPVGTAIGGTILSVIAAGVIAKSYSDAKRAKEGREETPATTTSKQMFKEISENLGTSLMVGLVLTAVSVGLFPLGLLWLELWVQLS